MIKLFLLLKKIHYVLLFLILETVALYFYAHNDPYKNAVMLASTASMSASVDGNIEGVKGYFELSSVNDDLRAQNAKLIEQLRVYREADTLSGDSVASVYKGVVVLKVVKNSYSKQHNTITLQGGLNQGIRPRMALFNGDGIVGYIMDCSDNYSVATSLLNSGFFKSSGRLKNTDFTGSIFWDGIDYRYLKISELPKYVNLNKGDTILTTSFSNIFPPDMPIGVIESFELTNGTFYEGYVKLFADMSALNYVYATSIDDQLEREFLETKNEVGK